MWNSNHRRRGTLILVLILSTLTVISTAGQRDQESVTTSSKIFDERQFVSYQVATASSPPLLRNLAENEEIIYILIKDFYTRYGPTDMHLKAPTLPPFKLMHSYLMNFEITTGELKLDFEKQKENTHYRAYKTAWNPLTTYFMMQRFLKPLKEIVRSLNTTRDPEFALQKQILNVMKVGGWPVEEDLKSAMRAILRIQHVYDLPTYQVSIGKLAEFDTNINLSPVDCVEIGKQALVEAFTYYALAVEWFEVAQYKLKHIPGVPAADITGPPVYEDAVDNFLKHAIELHDHHWAVSEKWDPLYFTTPCKNVSSLLRVRRRTTELQAWKGGTTSNLAHINYWGTCAGENYKSESDKAKLFCWYETEVTPYTKINPLKAELLSIDPLTIIQYYDMIGDQMIEKIKLDSNNRLAHSVVFTDNVNTGVSLIRTSLNSWIDDNTDPKFYSIPQKIEVASGLRVGSPTSSELLQVAAYTSGGHYSVHLDALASKNVVPDEAGIPQGDRLATFIFYLTDVEKGGGTSFPQSGIASEPIKGSAVLWYNLRRNGEIDDYTWHGACPVIIGEKWICNKWIRSDDQMFLTDYQCDPDQNARFQLKINGKNLMDLV